LDLTAVITTTNYRVRNAHGITDRLINEYLINAIQE
jgi:hypothetical protein